MYHVTNMKTTPFLLPESTSMNLVYLAKAESRR